MMRSGRVLRFALARRTVAVDPAEDKALAGAITGSARIKLTDWEANVCPETERQGARPDARRTQPQRVAGAGD